MVELDYVAFLIAGVLGVTVDNRLAWGLVGIWGLLKLVKVL